MARDCNNKGMVSVPFTYFYYEMTQGKRRIRSNFNDEILVCKACMIVTWKTFKDKLSSYLMYCARNFSICLKIGAFNFLQRGGLSLTNKITCGFAVNYSSICSLQLCNVAFQDATSKKQGPSAVALYHGRVCCGGKPKAMQYCSQWFFDSQKIDDMWIFNLNSKKGNVHIFARMYTKLVAWYKYERFLVDSHCSLVINWLTMKFSWVLLVSLQVSMF